MPVRFETSPGVFEDLTPAPLVSIRSTSVRDSAGNKLRNDYIITLTGTIVNVGTDKDSPHAQSFDFGKMQDILNEQARIRQLFSNEGGMLEIEDPNGTMSNNLYGYCLVESIDFPPSTWTTRCDYVITLTSQQLNPNPETFDLVEQTTNDWSVQENSDGTIALTHNLSARGILTYAQSGVVSDPLQSAKDWCLNRSYSVGVSGTITPYSVESFGLGDFIVSLPSGNYWNKAVNESASTSTNTYTYSEVFVYNPSGLQREEYEVSVNEENDDPYRKVVTITGTIFGYAAKESNYGLKYSRASGYFENTVKPNLFTRVSSYVPAGFTVLPNARSNQITHQIFNGVLQYTYNYGATSGSLIPNAITESISITDTGQNDVFATIQVPNRANGPVVQYMGTKTLPERSINIEAQISLSPMTGGSGLPSTSGLPNRYLQKPYTSDIINAIKPNAGSYYLTSDTENWDPIRGQYSRSTSWTLNPESNTVYGLPSGVATST